MPSGIYQLRANAFQRAGETQAAYTQYAAGNETISTSLYIKSTTKPVMSIYDDRQSARLHNDDIKLPDDTYVPCIMKAASTYFSKGLYDSNVATEVTTAGENLRIGIKCTKAPTWYWTIFDHFRLLFYGQNRTVLGIDEIYDNTDGGMQSGIEGAITNRQCFDLSGRRITSPNKLKHGIYIINGQKFVR